VDIGPAEKVVDAGSGAGLDCIIASKMAGGEGEIVGVDMTQEMVEKARGNAKATGVSNVTFHQGLFEQLPVNDEWADVVISNGSLNLAADKDEMFNELNRVLKPGGRLQVADILVDKPIPDEAKRNIDLWTG
jgi:ubiquinone/menaquinone biosynthesis C-methylase UbiE